PSVNTSVAPVTNIVANTDMSMAPDIMVDKNIPDTPEKEKTPEVLITGNNSGDNTIANSHSDESMKTVSENLDHEKSAEKDKEPDLNVV
ncbi:hypothetical protein A2U01_0083137, partial [Trifolium medium]|nr:hypothetical protein [Trifolium medium]